MSEYVTVWVDDLPDLKRGEEIVRCRDCEHGLWGGKMCDRLDPGYDEYWFDITPDGYCAWAERREQ